MLLATVLAVGVLSSACWAEWHVIMDEHFNRDPQRNTWPWVTDWRNPQKGWYHNPRNWPTAIPNFTNCSWGYQDGIFSGHILQNEEFPGSIWCAYCTQEGPNNPQWYDVDEYWNNSNAWAGWGLFNTEDAVSAVVSFWYRIDVDHYARDTLSVVIIETDWWTSNHDVFRENCGFGRTFNRGNRDFQINRFYLDSLILDGDTVSYLGRDDDLLLCFVWQSDSFAIAGTGAYIDDVMVAWDDGLFDIYPYRVYFGHIITEDSTYWTRKTPREDDEVLFRLDWKAVGSEGETPEFTIECLLNDELIYSERRQVAGSEDTVYTTMADTLWTAIRGEHMLTWVIDVGEEVEESNENNNLGETPIPIEWNPPPELEIMTPVEDSTVVYVGDTCEVHYAVSDSNDSDTHFAILFYLTEDTTGLAEDPDLIYDYISIGANHSALGGEGTTQWIVAENLVDLLLWVVVLANDGEPSNNTIAVSPGRFWVQVLGVSEGRYTGPGGFGLIRAYPNPFNRSLTVEYTLAVSGRAHLAAFDLAGRQIAVLADGQHPAGSHSITWSPSGIPGGVYMLKLETGGEVSMQKAVYMP